MKKFFLLLITFCSISVFAFAVDVPKAVAEAFAKKFPGALNIKWGKENAKEYEAEFKLNGKSGSANFLTDGSWVETEMQIDILEAPAPVTAAVKQKHPGTSIIKLYKIDNNKGELTYEAEIKTGNKKSEIVLKADGTIIK